MAVYTLMPHTATKPQNSEPKAQQTAAATQRLSTKLCLQTVPKAQQAATSAKWHFSRVCSTSAACAESSAAFDCRSAKSNSSTADKPKILSAGLAKTLQVWQMVAVGSARSAGLAVCPLLCRRRYATWQKISFIPSVASTPEQPLSRLQSAASNAHVANGGSL